MRHTMTQLSLCFVLLIFNVSGYPADTAKKPAAAPIVIPPKTIKTETLQFTGDGPTEAEIAAQKKAEADKAKAKQAAEEKAKAEALAKQKAEEEKAKVEVEAAKKAEENKQVTAPTTDTAKTEKTQQPSTPVPAKPAITAKPTAPAPAPVAQPVQPKKPAVPATKPVVPAPQPIAKPNQPPVITSIEIPKDIRPGQKFKADITATDDEGVLALAVIYNKQKQPSIKSPDPKKTQNTFTIELEAPKSGEITIQAMVLDSKGTKSAVKEEKTTLAKHVATTQQEKKSKKPDSTDTKSWDEKKAEVEKQLKDKRAEAATASVNDQTSGKSASDDKTSSSSSTQATKEDNAALKEKAAAADAKAAANQSSSNQTSSNNSSTASNDTSEPPPPAPTGTPTITAHDANVNTGSSFTIQWSSIEGASTYHYLIADNPDFNLAQQGSVSATQKSFTRDVASTKTYYFKVRGSNAGGQGSFSNVVTTQVVVASSTPSDRPQLVSPQAGGNIASAEDEFRWRGIANADGYVICIKNNASDSGCFLQSSPPVPGSEAGAGEETGSGLGSFYSVVAGTQKFWTVKAYLPGGTVKESTARIVGFTSTGNQQQNAQGTDENELSDFLITLLSQWQQSLENWRGQHFLQNPDGTNTGNAQSATALLNQWHNALESWRGQNFLAEPANANLGNLNSFQTFLQQWHQALESWRGQNFLLGVNEVNEGGTTTMPMMMTAELVSDSNVDGETIIASQAAANLKNAGKTPEEIAVTLKNTHNLDAGETLQVLLGIDIDEKPALKATKTVFNNMDPQVAANVFKAVNSNAVDAARALKDIFVQVANIDWVMARLYDAGYTVESLAYVLKNLYNLGDQAVAEVLERLNVGAKAILEALVSIFGSDPPAIVVYLKDLGFNVIDIVSAFVETSTGTYIDLGHWLIDAGFAAGPIIEAFVQHQEIGFRSIIAFAKDVGYSLVDIVQLLVDEFQLTAPVIMTELIDIGYDVMDTAVAILTVIGTANIETVQWMLGTLQDHGIPAEDAAEFIHDRLNTTGRKTIEYMRDAGYAVGPTARAVWREFSVSIATAVGWLKAEGVSITTITNVLKNTFSLTPAEAIQILFDIGFEIGEITSAIANAFGMAIGEVSQMILSLGL